MIGLENLFAQRSQVVAKVKNIQERISEEDCAIRPTLARLKTYQSELQCHYREYQRVYGELLSALPAVRFEELDEDYWLFEDIHDKACVLVETLLISCPTTSDKGFNKRRSSSSYSVTTTTCWLSHPNRRSQLPSQTTKQLVPSPDVFERSRSSLPKKVSTSVTNPIQTEKPHRGEYSTDKKIPLRGPAEVQPESDFAEVTIPESAITLADEAAKCEEEVTAVAFECPTYESKHPSTSQEDVLVGNEPAEFVGIPSEELKTPTSSKAPSGTNPVVNTFRIPFDPTGVHPKLTIPILTGCHPVLKPFRPPPGFHSKPMRIPKPAGMPPVSQYPTGSLPVPQPPQCKAGSLPAYQQQQSPIGLLPVPESSSVSPSLQCKAGSLPAFQPQHNPTGSYPVSQTLQFVTESRSVTPQFESTTGSYPVQFQRVTGSHSATNPILRSTGASPVVDSALMPVDTRSAAKMTKNSTGTHPVINSAMMFVGSSPTVKPTKMLIGARPMVKSNEMPAGSRPVVNSIQVSTGSCPVDKPLLMSAGASPVGKPSLPPSSIGTSPVVNPTVDTRSAVKKSKMSAGSRPVLKSHEMPAGSRPVVKANLVPIGSRPVVKSSQMSSGSRPVDKPLLMSAGACPVDKPILRPPSIGTSSVVKPTVDTRSAAKTPTMFDGPPPVATPIPMSIGTSPVGNCAPMSVGSRPTLKPNPMSAGSSPVDNSALKPAGSCPATRPNLKSVGARPMVESYQMPTGSCPVFKPLPKHTGTSPVRKRVLTSAGARPVTKSIMIAIDIRPVVKLSSKSVGTCPMARTFLKLVGTSPMIKPKPFPKSTGTSLVVKPIVMSAGTSPAAKPFVVSAGLRPVTKPPLKFAGSRPVDKPVPKPAETRPMTNSSLTPTGTPTENPSVLLPVMSDGIQRIAKPIPKNMCPTEKLPPTTAGIRPAPKRIQSLEEQVSSPKITGTRPVVREPPEKKKWIVVFSTVNHPPLDPPPVSPTGECKQLHSDPRPKKPPDGLSKRSRSSEAIPERVSRTRPPNDPKKDEPDATGEQAFDLWCVNFLSWL
nr:proline-rich extensin-like protein EPR1 [Aedes albopictus]